MFTYNDNPQATCLAIHNKVFAHSDDLRCIDALGHIKLTDRVKEIMIHSSLSLFSAQIERAMLEHDAINKIAVTRSPDNKWQNKPPILFVIALTKHYERPT